MYWFRVLVSEPPSVIFTYWPGWTLTVFLYVWWYRISVAPGHWGRMLCKKLWLQLHPGDTLCGARSEPEGACLFGLSAEPRGLTWESYSTHRLNSLPSQSTSHQHHSGTHLHSTSADAAQVQAQVAEGGIWRSGPLSFLFSVSLLSPDGEIGWDAGSDALRDPQRQPEQPGSTAGNVCSGWCTSARCVSPCHVLLCYLPCALTEGKLWTFHGRFLACQHCCRNCHIPPAPWRSTLRSALLFPPLLPAAGGQEGGASGFVRSSSACVAQTVRSQDSPVITRQSASYLK